MYKPEQNAIINNNRSLISIKPEKNLIIGSGGEISVGKENSNGRLFDNDETVETLTIGGKIEKIKPFAFSGCKNLRKVIILGSVKKLGYGCFMDCPKLTLVFLPNSLDEMKCTAFAHNPNTTIIIYDNGGERNVEILKQKLEITHHETCVFTDSPILSLERELSEEFEGDTDQSLIGDMEL